MGLVNHLVVTGLHAHLVVLNVFIISVKDLRWDLVSGATFPWSSQLLHLYVYFLCQSEKSLSSDLIKESRQQFHHLACLLTAARLEPPGQENRNHFRFCLTPYQQHWTHLLFLSVFSSLFPNFHSPWFQGFCSLYSEASVSHPAITEITVIFFFSLPKLNHCWETKQQRNIYIYIYTC